ncbi:hypothetical protein BS17DRAFT_689038 [Gyrodon lividus]|nr:hypothetical protein BS17DRAFT_689038 [Gyrodon lividus]
MPASEIDDIFASRGKLNIVSKSPHAFSPPTDKKRKKQKNKTHLTPVEEAQVPSSKKHSAPETVVDPSVQPAPKKRPKFVASSNSTQKSSKDQLREVEERFKDSRGSAPRRTTKEGYNIYKADELGISARGGGQLRRLIYSCTLTCMSQRHFIMSIRLRLLCVISYFSGRFYFVDIDSTGF